MVAGAFYTDCRLFRVSEADAASAFDLDQNPIGNLALQGPGHAVSPDAFKSPAGAGDGMLSMDSLTDAAKNAAADAAKSAASAAVDAAKKAAGGSLPGLDSTEGAVLNERTEGEPEPAAQCARLRGLFASRKLTNNILEVEAKAKNPADPPRDLAGVNADGAGSHGFYVLHSPTHLWFRCFLFGRGREAHLECIPYQQNPRSAKCGGLLTAKKCDYDRQTFRTECLKKKTGILSTDYKCIYTGHLGESQGLDMLGKPVPYGVYVLSCPIPPLIASSPLAAAEAANVARRRHEDFLGALASSAISTGAVPAPGSKVHGSIERSSDIVPVWQEWWP
eukprot:gnl/TRDRNA2_/TRDRNA2_75493_c0_seq1.p1 gnl/TRDRNA2_/TRDRNA2_75493_c0~~gnl/TRDRNA2_/TRDRNA2_75493_c0_seq1.p1  ORF type:complete len:334 (+),score=42.96 gnl/TRDRNA2_/TRDRNA2_75493_c0_seq1:104-1105(+)